MKEYWYINEENEPERVDSSDYIEDIENLEEIGLLFKTKEEAERAVKKLKAYKQLKDKGLKVKAFDYCMPYLDELNLLFGEMKKNK